MENNISSNNDNYENDDSYENEGNENKNAAKKKGGAAAGKKGPVESPEEASARLAAEQAINELETILSVEKQLQKRRVDLLAAHAVNGLKNLDKMFKGLHL